MCVCVFGFVFHACVAVCAAACETHRNSHQFQFAEGLLALLQLQLKPF